MVHYGVMYLFTSSISHGVENYFSRLWGTGISDAIFKSADLSNYNIVKLQTCG